MKIYTKTGDQGETGLLGGLRVNKTHLAIDVCGCLDETNSMIGVVRSLKTTADVESKLFQIQNDLFDLGSRVADCLAATGRVAEFGVERTTCLEKWIDEIQSKLPELLEFILPSGSPAGAQLHLARAVCRRSERRLVALIESDPKRDLQSELVYLNRLGDLLFVMARFVNLKSGQTESKWRATGN